MNPSIKNGTEAEQRAAEYLTKGGFEVILVNTQEEQYLPYDILASKDNITYAINVRSTQSYGYIFGHCNIKKLQKVCEQTKNIPAFLFVRKKEFNLFVLREIIIPQPAEDTGSLLPSTSKIAALKT